MNASTADIQQILRDMRIAIDNNLYTFITREKNKNTLSQLGFTYQNVVAEIYELEVKDYISGPEVDRDRPNSDFLWVFKKNIDGNIIYIKFKVQYQTDNSVKILSFHIDYI